MPGKMEKEKKEKERIKSIFAYVQVFVPVRLHRARLSPFYYLTVPQVKYVR